MVPHVVLQVTQRQRFVRLNPQRQVVALVEVTVDVRLVFVHLLMAVMVAEKAPHAGVSIAHVLEVDRAIGITEREILILAIVETPFFSKTNDIGSIDTFHFGAVDLLEVLAADAGVFPFFLQRELSDSAQVGMGADAVVGDTQGHPNSTFIAWPFADDFHNPSFVRVTNGERLATAVIAILLN